MCLPQVIKSFQNYRGVATTFYPTLVYIVAHGCMFGMLLFISVGYIFLLLCLCFLIVIHVLFSTLTEVFPCFSLSCKANARVYLAKTGHGPHSYLFHVLIVLFYVLLCVDCVVHVFFV